MTPAEKAYESAIHFEGIKHAYRQTKDGVVISFVVHPHDVPKGLAEAPLGSRYIVALVQVGDDEQPVHQPAKEKNLSEKEPATPQPPSPSAAAERTASGEASSRSRMNWRELQPAAQAGIRCEDPVFQAFLREAKGYGHCDEKDAAVVVRDICGVQSRAELSTNHKARVLWHQLDSAFLAWKYVDA